ncbi:hypothetical protein QC999_gp25 [Microbacterium phage Cressida]|uniref:Uncharacterized protein n=1 Tax=Microbacterium phage Cressida TaxID=2591216 RepID=A0A514DIA3_9CAUD|nr:hypothetical protein QC999_gp25 [Microbacterium phage Cressida]QDH93325.1 hypothetical protein PBI_CRESSIDA_83 [Microbacterium phage Cressida]
MSTPTIEYTGTLVVTSCWCGIQLGIPSSLHRKAQADSKTAIFCPLGHEFIYGKNEADRQRERADRAERDARLARASRDAARDQAAAAHRSAIAYKGHVTRLRNRIAAGVCPVAGCRRHFDNVQAHIEGQHPDWAAEHPEALA